MSGALASATGGLIQTSNFAHTFGIILMIFLGVIIAAGFIVLIVWSEIYKYKLFIHKQDGGIYKKRAKKFRLQGGVYRLMMYRPKRVLLQGDLIGKNSYHYYEDKNGDLWPYFWQNLKKQLEKDPSYELQPLIRMEKDATAKQLHTLTDTKGFWEKYGVIIGFVTLAFIFGIGLYLSGQNLSKTAAASQSSAQLMVPMINHMVNISQVNYQQTVLMYTLLQEMKNSNITIGSSNYSSGLVSAGGSG